MNPPSVYERVLGARLDALDPGLRRYFGAIPPGSVGVGTGVFVVAGSRLRWLRPVWAFLGWRRVLFAEHGRDVPFTVLNTPQPDGSLTAERTVHFEGRRRVMVDRMRVENGALVDRIGRRGGLEVTLDATVAAGELRLASRRVALRLGAVRIPFTRLAAVTVRERAAARPAQGQSVDVRLTTPILGEGVPLRGHVHVRHLARGRRRYCVRTPQKRTNSAADRGFRCGVRDRLRSSSEEVAAPRYFFLSDFSETGASPDAASAA